MGNTDRGSIHKIGLRFFSFRAEFLTDVPEVAAVCRDLFLRFIDSEGSPSYSLEIRSTASGSWQVRDTDLDAIVDRRDWLEGIVTARLLETTGNEVEDHDLYHAAAVSRGDRGLALFGESGFGKSTLTLALLARGWRFLSDEVAAIDRVRGFLTPFPKAIEIRPGTARIVGLSPFGPRRKAGKMIEDAETLYPNCLGRPCPLAAVVFLDSDERPTDPAEREWLRIGVHRRVEILPRIVSGLDGVAEVKWDGETSGCHVLAIRCRRDRFPASSLDRLLGRHGVLIMASSAEERPPADFDREPRLEPLESHAGVMRLLGRFRGRRAFERRMKRHGGDFGELFVSLLEQFRETRFYRLEIGRLERMVALMDRVVE